MVKFKKHLEKGYYLSQMHVRRKGYLKNCWEKNLRTNVLVCQEIKFMLLKLLYGRGGKLRKSKERKKP